MRISGGFSEILRFFIFFFFFFKSFHFLSLIIIIFFFPTAISLFLFPSLNPKRLKSWPPYVIIDNHPKVVLTSFNFLTVVSYCKKGSHIFIYYPFNYSMHFQFPDSCFYHNKGRYIPLYILGNFINMLFFVLI